MVKRRNELSLELEKVRTKVSTLLRLNSADISFFALNCRKTVFKFGFFVRTLTDHPFLTHVYVQY